MVLPLVMLYVVGTATQRLDCCACSYDCACHVDVPCHLDVHCVLHDTQPVPTASGQARADISGQSYMVKAFLVLVVHEFTSLSSIMCRAVFWIFCQPALLQYLHNTGTGVAVKLG